MPRAKRVFIILLAIWLLVSTFIVTIIVAGDPVARAILAMGWGLIILWVLIAGSLMYKYRDSVKRVFTRIPLPWPVKFTIFVTGLMLIEEAVTTLMTNLAPVFGVKMGEAFITASSNYFEVVFLHSVIYFIGPFIFWALVLRKRDFSPFAAFIIFGLMGTLAEIGLAGPQAILQFGLWIFVYGLMIYLPVYCLPSAAERGAKPAEWYLHILMIFLPLLFVPLTAWVPPLLDI